MHTAEELDRMITEMNARTGDGPVQIVCSQETLDQLWLQTGNIYSSAADIENGTGYVARYMGTPIVVSPDVEPGKIYLIPRKTEDSPVRFIYDNHTGGLEDSGQYWLRSPISGDEFSHVGGGYRFTSPVDNQMPDIERIIEQVRNDRTIKKKVDKPKSIPTDDEPVSIDEDSFLDIIKGGATNVPTWTA